MVMHQVGFTLAEAVVTLCVLGCFVALAAPAAHDAVQEARLRAATGDLLQHLVLARSEAIKRNARVVLCHSADGVTCSDAGGWQQGWILFHDANRNGVRDPQEAILQRINPLPPDLRLSGNGPVERYVAYDALGTTRMVSGAFQAGTFTVCRASADAADARQIVVSAGGRPRVQKIRVDSCF